MEIEILSVEYDNTTDKFLEISSQGDLSRFYLSKNNHIYIGSQLMKAAISLLSEQELYELLAEYGYVNRDSLIGGGL